MTKKESKKRRVNLGWLAVAVMFVVFGASAFAQDDPIVDNALLELHGRIEGTGTYFEITDSEYLNITLQSSEPVNLTLESVPEMIEMDIEAAEGATSSEITLTGFLPSTTYYKYEDDYHNSLALTTDDNGSYTYVQDLSEPHLVFIQTQPGTIFLSASGWDDGYGSDPGVGTWDQLTQTGTLIIDVSETIQIDDDNLTLDGDGFTITGPGWGHGVHANSRAGVTIKNLNVQGFSHGIYIGYSNGNTLTGNTSNLNSWSGIYLSYSANNTVTGNTACSNLPRFGILLSESRNNTVTGNTLSDNWCGIFLTSSSNNNMVTNNTVLGDNTGSWNSYAGIFLDNSNNNTLMGNISLNNISGIRLNSSSNNNILTDNTSSSSAYAGICVMDACSNNTVRGNSASDNYGNGMLIWTSNDTTLISNTVNWNGGEGIYIAGCNGNTLTGNTISSNLRNGMRIEVSSKNNLTGNTTSNNYATGIKIVGCSDNTLTNNTASNNNSGIGISSSSNSMVTGNAVSINNVWGIAFDHTSNSVVRDNTITLNNYGLGIHWLCNDNQFYNNNFIQNIITQAYAYLPQHGGGTGNVYNIDKPTGGNYWSDLTGPDDDGDGFVDLPYVFDGGQDNLPWALPDGWVNQAPEAIISSPSSGFVEAVNTPINFAGDIIDPDIDDTHTATWTISNENWIDDLIVYGIIDERTVSNTIEFDEPGIYSIKLTVTDSHGESDETTIVNDEPESPAFIVIYNPDGGFVTGGGWIDSPAGAYMADQLLTGKANFGFVSKYKKGATVPTGQTEFVFKAGDLNFHSSSYDWLVIAGEHKAMFKGEGTINGAGNYGFILSAVDAAQTPSTSEDLFRIKIWDKDAGDAIVYDNQLGEADDADPTTAIGGGSIVIHKK